MKTINVTFPSSKVSSETYSKYYKFKLIFNSEDNVDKIIKKQLALDKMISEFVTQNMNNFIPDIIHCNDWHTALVPMLLKTRYAESEFFSHTRSVLTIHNGAFQGVVERNQLWAVPEITDTYNESILQGHAYINFLKCGVAYAD